MRILCCVLTFANVLSSVLAFQAGTNVHHPVHVRCFTQSTNQDEEYPPYYLPQSNFSRRQAMGSVIHAMGLSTLTCNGPFMSQQALAADESMFAPSFVHDYEDFTKVPAGFSYRDIYKGNGESAKQGDRVVYDWSGYTIGYFGRPFQAKGGPRGGAFDNNNLDYERTVLGSGQVVGGLEGAMAGMKTGGVRQVIVPYGPLSYPSDDPNHDRIGPKPATFSGMRALNFVLDNPRIDRTLLFNVKVIRVDRPNGKGGFVRG